MNSQRAAGTPRRRSRVVAADVLACGVYALREGRDVVAAVDHALAVELFGLTLAGNA